MEKKEGFVDGNSNNDNDDNTTTAIKISVNAVMNEMWLPNDNTIIENYLSSLQQTVVIGTGNNTSITSSSVGNNHIVSGRNTPPAIRNSEESNINIPPIPHKSTLPSHLQNSERRESANTPIIQNRNSIETNQNLDQKPSILIVRKSVDGILPFDDEFDLMYCHNNLNIPINNGNQQEINYNSLSLPPLTSSTISATTLASQVHQDKQHNIVIDKNIATRFATTSVTFAFYFCSSNLPLTDNNNNNNTTSNSSNNNNTKSQSATNTEKASSNSKLKGRKLSSTATTGANNNQSQQQHQQHHHNHQHQQNLQQNRGLELGSISIPLFPFLFDRTEIDIHQNFCKKEIDFVDVKNNPISQFLSKLDIKISLDKTIETAIRQELLPMSISVISAGPFSCLPHKEEYIVKNCEKPYVKTNLLGLSFATPQVPLQIPKISWNHTHVLLLGPIISINNQTKSFIDCTSKLDLELHDRDRLISKLFSDRNQGQVKQQQEQQESPPNINTSNSEITPINNSENLISNHNTSYHGSSSNNIAAIDPHGVVSLSLYDIIYHEGSLIKSVNYVLPVSGVTRTLESFDVRPRPNDYVAHGTMLTVKIEKGFNSHIPSSLLPLLPQSNINIANADNVNNANSCKNTMIYRRLICIVKSSEPFVRRIIEFISRNNAAALHIDENQEAAMENYRFSPSVVIGEEPPIISGFRVFDKKFNIFVLEGFPSSIAGIRSIFGDNFMSTKNVNVLYNEELGFATRNYSKFNAILKTLKLTYSFQYLFHSIKTLIGNKITQDCYQALHCLYELTQSTFMLQIVRKSCFPSVSQILALEQHFSAGLTFKDVAGVGAQSESNFSHSNNLRDRERDNTNNNLNETSHNNRDRAQVANNHNANLNNEYFNSGNAILSGLKSRMEKKSPSPATKSSSPSFSSKPSPPPPSSAANTGLLRFQIHTSNTSYDDNDDDGDESNDYDDGEENENNNGRISKRHLKFRSKSMIDNNTSNTATAANHCNQQKKKREKKDFILRNMESLRNFEIERSKGHVESEEYFILDPYSLNCPKNFVYSTQKLSIRHQLRKNIVEILSKDVYRQGDFGPGWNHTADLIFEEKMRRKMRQKGQIQR